MLHFFQEIILNTTQEMEFVDLTKRAQDCVKKSGIQNGLLIVATQHTTTAVILNEKEEGLQKDMALFLGKLAAARQGYLHDRSPVDGRTNAHSHLQSLLLPSSQTVPLVDGEIKLGSWQSLFFVELDGPRSSRRVTVQVVGA